MGWGLGGELRLAGLYWGRCSRMGGVRVSQNARMESIYVSRGLRSRWGYGWVGSSEVR